MLMKKPECEWIEIDDSICTLQTSGQGCPDAVVGGGSYCSGTQPASCGYSSAFNS